MANAKYLLKGEDWKIKPFISSEAVMVGVHKPEYDDSSWTPASVPSCSHRELEEAGVLPEIWFGTNSLSCEWVENRDFAWRKWFEAPAELAGKRVLLRFEGVDYDCTVYLDGEELGSHTGMFSPFEFDVTARLRPGQRHLLCVIVYAPPKEEAQMGWTKRVKTFKPRMNYNWDFTCRLVPSGIWQPVSLDVLETVRCTDVWAKPLLAEDHKSAQVHLEAELEATCEQVAEVWAEIWREEGDRIWEGKTLAALYPGTTRVTFTGAIPDPALWWPNGQGQQPRYIATIYVSRACEPIDKRSVAFGIRSIGFVPNEGAPADTRPWTLVVNGQKTFIKGWNWAPCDSRYGGIPDERYQRLIQLAKEAGVNMLRINGVGLMEQEAFYEACDEAGIMVWQEFVLSGSARESIPSTSQDYLDLLTAECVPSIRRLRNRASLALWCGGNELTDLGGEADVAINHMGRLVAQYDGTRPYLPTSPMTRTEPNQDIHGPWTYIGVVNHYTHYNDNHKALIHSEYGCCGMAALPSLMQMLPPESLEAPRKEDLNWRHHKAFEAIGDPHWLGVGLLEEMYGAQYDTLLDWVHASQFQQAEGLRYAIETNRRRKFTTSGSLMWQFNEPWPNAACTSAVDWYLRPKMAYWYVRKAYEAVHVSAKYARLGWRSSETFTTDLWVSNSGAALEGALLEWRLSDLHGKVLLQSDTTITVPANSSVELASVAWHIPEGFSGPFICYVRCKDAAGETLSTNYYYFSVNTEPVWEPYLQAPGTFLAVEVEATPEGKFLRIANEGDTFALHTELEVLGPSADRVVFSDNYLSIRPGKVRRLWITGQLTSEDTLRIQAWNSNELLIPVS